MLIEDKPLVSVARNINIAKAVNKTLDQIEIPDLSGKTVLLKPNVGREADPKLGINTNPEVVETVFNYLKKRFDAKYLIGDSPIINTDTRKAFEQSGYTDLLRNEDLKFIDLDEKSPLELEIPNSDLAEAQGSRRNDLDARGICFFGDSGATGGATFRWIECPGRTRA